MSFMDYTEIKHRLNRGENALSLTIEAWERKLEFIQEGADTTLVPLSCADCPLCVKADKDCGNCVLGQNGFKCTSLIDNPYGMTVRVLRYNKEDTGQPYSLEEKRIVVEHMIKVLKSLQEKPKFMDPIEIKLRLLKGEDPLSLSIEAWERKSAALDGVSRISYLPMSSNDCPLCHVYSSYDFDTDATTCRGCPLNTEKLNCHNKESPYKLAADAVFGSMNPETLMPYTLKEKKERVDNMIKVMKELQNEHREA